MDKQKLSCNLEVWGGIECTINRVKNHFFDQLEDSDHYNRPQDIELIADLGIKKIRYPVLWEKHQKNIDDPINWDWIAQRLNQLKSKNIDVIAGLVHHGSGPAFTNLFDENFPFLLSGYAKQVAEKFPWINYYTPVNEPLTTARFSGLYGVWYPHAADDKSFMTMLLNEVKGVVLSMQEIRKINPNAKLIQTEDLAKVYSTPELKYQADFENERRWLTLDLLCGKVDASHALWNYLKWLGFSDKELLFFKENPCPPDILGFNHYVTSERFLDERIHLYPEQTHGGNSFQSYADVEAVRVELEEDSGIEVLLKEAWNRFQLPMAVTEVHLHCHREEQLRWFKYVWQACKNVISEGVNVQAITAWAILGSYGWNKLLTQPKGEYEPGVFDLRNGFPRPTALANFIKKITSKEKCYHPTLSEAGWWHRPTRFLYEPVLQKANKITSKRENKNPLLIIGKRGTLGKAFARVCNDRAIKHVLLGREDCDIAYPQAIEAAIDIYKPWAIVNAAGYVRVDDAEMEFDACYRDNAFGPQNLAIACNKYGIKLVSFSSDLVFDGQKSDYYVESDEVNPLNVYGKSKAYSEELIMDDNPAALIIRTSAFFGPWDNYNFLEWVFNQLVQSQTVPVANDVYVSPTYVPDLVHTSLDLLIDDEKGIWHLANSGKITWADLADEVAGKFQLNKNLIKALPLEEMDLPARRPYFSALSSKRGNLLPTLDNALHRYFDMKHQMMLT